MASLTLDKAPTPNRADRKPSTSANLEARRRARKARALARDNAQRELSLALNRGEVLRPTI